MQSIKIHTFFLILYNIFSHIASGGAAGHKKYPLSSIIGRKGIQNFLSSIRFAPKDHTFCRLSAAHTGIAQMLLIVGDTS